MQEKSVPELRFKEFNNGWRRCHLGDTVSFSKGKGISKSDIVSDGINPCIRYGELYTTYDEIIDEPISATNIDKDQLVFSKGNEVIIPSSGESNLDIATAACVVRSNVALGGDLNILSSDQSGVFLAYYLNNPKKYDIARLAQGVSVVHLYNSGLKSLRLNLPSLPEQQKIADFLTSVDRKIQALTRKVELLKDYKKGVMQKVFNCQWLMVNGQLTFVPPEIRFRDDNGEEFPDWEEKKLGDFYKNLKTGQTPSRSVSSFFDGHIPWITSGELNFGEIVRTNESITEAGRNDANLRIYEKGTFFIAITGLEAPGTRGRCGINMIPSTTNQSCMAFEPLKSMNTRFLHQWYLHYGIRLYYKFAQGTKQQSFNNKIVEDFNFLYPVLQEQTQIANFLTSIDDKIDTQEKKLEKMKEWKKGLLQTMFV